MLNISTASKFKLYYTPAADGTTDIKEVQIIGINPSYETDLINYNYRLYFDNTSGKQRYTGREPLAYSYTSDENYLVKLIRPPGVDKIEIIAVSNNAETVLATYDYKIIDPNTGVVSYNPDYYFWAVLRFNYMLQDEAVETSEVEIHEFTRDSHYERMRYSFFEINNQSLMRKEFMNGLFGNNIAEVVNGNLLTKSYQIFHLGSLINDRYNMEK